MHVGVLSPVTGGSYFGDVLTGVVREVAAAGGRVTLVQTMDAGMSGDEVGQAPDLSVPIGWDHIDGFVAVALASSSGYLNRLREAGKPVVLISNTLDDVDAASVVADNRRGVAEAVQHLAGHGHTRIAFVGNVGQTDIAERHEGYLAAMDDCGLATDGLDFPAADHIETGGAAVVERILASPEHITAVVASTDRVAIGLIKGLVAAGIRVPQDVAVVGFDNMEIGWHASPPLSTVEHQVAELGARAAQLLLAELRGDAVEHRRYTIPSTLVPRGTCDCPIVTIDLCRQGETDGRAVASSIAKHLGVPLFEDPVTACATIPATVDLAALAGAIEDAIREIYPRTPAPETVAQFAQTLIGMLADASSAVGSAGGAGGEVLRHCIVGVTLSLSRLHALNSYERAQQLSVSLAEQYEVGIELLGKTGSDPRELNWLNRVSVRLGCLAIWRGDPQDGLLDVTGVYDPEGVTTGTRDAQRRVPETCRVQAFPPPAIVDQADPTRKEVTFVVPVKGTSGDHGLLCVVGTVDTHTRTGRATYNQWAALLGVALKQRGLLETVRLSEERYSLAATATQDGLWDWYVAEGRCYYSERCQEMLGIDSAEAARSGLAPWPEQSTLELDPWMRRVHPDDLERLRLELRRAVVTQEPVEIEHRIAGTDGGYDWVVCRARPVGERGQRARRVVGSLSDIHERKVLEERLRQAALFDDVTGLPNRRLFIDRLTWAVDQVKRLPGTPFAVLFLDLDGFKDINDSLGHIKGDELLKLVGARLRAELRSVDTAARFGGDEFAVLLFGLKHEAVQPVVARIQASIAAPVMLGDDEVSVTASIGIATSDGQYANAEDVLRDADLAMYSAKETERGTACFFEPVMHSLASGRLRTHAELRTALAEHQFTMHYQPIVALDDSPLTRFEALIRWEHPTRGLLPPSEFLPMMAQTGSALVLSQWIIDTVCAQIASWRGPWDGELMVAVNLSHREFWSDQLIPIVTEALARHDVPPECLILEVTEAAIMANPDAARQVLEQLRDTGVHLHIDDFGTGRSTVSALRALPVDALKIDRSFVREIDVDAPTNELVRVIVGMGLTLGLDVVAEGVETDAQALQLRTMGCRTAQGWLYAAAVPGDEAAGLIGRNLLPMSSLAAES